MPDYVFIQLDAVFRHQQAAVHAVRRALTRTHGNEFADAFLHEHRASVIKAAQTRVCGHSEVAVVDAARTLRSDSERA